MKFGLLYLPTYVPELDGPVQTFYEHLLEQAARADELGYEAIWLTEHHFNVYGGTVPNPAVLGAALARATRRIRIGTAVTVLPLHNPLLVAEDFAMLDVVSNGRLNFGLGRGSVAIEYHEFGISPEASASIMDEATDVIVKAWSRESFSYSGKHFSFDNVSVLPRPVQQPHPPIYVGAARTPDTFSWAGRHGYHVMVLPYMFAPEFLQERLGLYFDALSAAGHDADSVEVVAKFHVFVAESRQEASQIAGPAYTNYQRIARERTGREHQQYWRDGSEWDDHVRDY